MRGWKEIVGSDGAFALGFGFDMRGGGGMAVTADTGPENELALLVLPRLLIRPCPIGLGCWGPGGFELLVFVLICIGPLLPAPPPIPPTLIPKPMPFPPTPRPPTPRVFSAAPNWGVGGLALLGLVPAL